MSRGEREQQLVNEAGNGDTETVARLLQDGVDVNCSNWLGDMPLHTAAWGGHVGVAELLVKAGAQVDNRNAGGNTALHRAARGGHVGVAELLLKAGAQVDSRNKNGDTPLHKAAEEGHVGVAELLLKAEAQVDSRDWYENTPLHRAAEGGHVGVAELLLKAGAQVDSRGEYGKTPLHKAASRGHVGVAELLLKAGAQVDSRNVSGKTPKDIAAARGVPLRLSSTERDRILKGRKEILELLETVNVSGPYRRKVGPEGGELQTPTCTVSAPSGAVAMETEITCQAINPNDVTLPLKDEEMLVSDIIELGPHDTTFHKPVTVQMQYSSVSLGLNREAAVWVTEDRSQWTELETTKLTTKDKVTVSVDHFSIFAVVSQPKQDQFTVSTEECTLTSSTQPAVQITFPEQSVTSPIEVIVQVQDILRKEVEDIKATEQSFHGLLSTSPIVNVETVSDSAVQFHNPVTVRVPHPQRYMNIQHEGPTKLRVMSCEDGTDDWVDTTDDTSVRLAQNTVEFEVIHFTRWIVIVVEDIYDDPEELGPIPLRLCRWLQCRPVQFILLQRETNENEVVIECALAKHAKKILRSRKRVGYTGPLPSGSVYLFEGQTVEIALEGNVSLDPGSRMTEHLTFHSKRDNRVHMQVTATESKDGKGANGKGSAVFYAVPRVQISRKGRSRALKSVAKLQQSSAEKPQKPTFLCQLPINPVERVDLSETSTGVGVYFHFIKENVAKDWKDLACFLGFEGPDIGNIAGRNHDDKSRCDDMLWEWKRMKGSAATIDVLMEALSEAKLQDVVDVLRKKYPELALR